METLWGIIVVIIAVAVSVSQNKKKTRSAGKRQGSVPNSMQQYDILDRAEANVNEIQTDAVKRSLFEAQSGAAPAGFDTDWEDGDSLMREVEDLMITGYQYSLSYERDFVGEGIEMLNGIEMPEVPEYIA